MPVLIIEEIFTSIVSCIFKNSNAQEMKFTWFLRRLNPANNCLIKVVLTSSAWFMFLFYIIVRQKNSLYIPHEGYWMHTPTRTCNLQNLLWSASVWSYDKDVIIVVQDSRLLLDLIITIFIFFILVRKRFLKVTTISSLPIRLPTIKCDFIVLLQLIEISLTVNEFH